MILVVIDLYGVLLSVTLNSYPPFYVVFLYGFASSTDYRKSVPQIRSGEYEGLKEKVTIVCLGMRSLLEVIL